MIVEILDACMFYCFQNSDFFVLFSWLVVLAELSLKLELCHAVSYVLAVIDFVMLLCSLTLKKASRS